MNLIRYTVFTKALQSERKTLAVILKEDSTAGALIDMHPVSVVVVDGKVANHFTPISKDSTITVHKGIEDPATISFFLLDAGLFLGAEYVVGSVISSLLLNVGLTLVSNAIFRPSGGGLVDRKVDDAGDSYSIAAARNSARPGQGWPWVMGNVRFTPDTAAQPWVHAVDDPESIRKQTVVSEVTEKVCSVDYEFIGDPESGNPVTTYIIKDCPAWSGFDSTDPEWIQQGATTIWRNQQMVITAATTAGQDVNSNTVKAMLYDTGTGLYQLENESVWGTLDQVHPTLTYTKSSNEDLPETAQRLNQVFSFGIGSLNITDFLIGQTEITEYRGLTLSTGQMTSDRVRLGIDNPRPDPLTGETGWWSNALVVDGAPVVAQNVNVPNDGWITRQYENSAGDVNHVAINLTYRLFYNGNEGPENRSMDVGIRFRFGTGAWVNRPTETFNNGDARNTFTTVEFPVSGTGVLSIAVRKITTDSDDARLTNDLAWDNVVFFRDFEKTSNPWSYNAAQNLLGLSVRSSSQLNGALDNLTANVSASTWFWPGAGDPVLPVNTSTGWTFGPTSNAADWWLTAARGVFLRTSPESNFPYSDKGWTIGKNAAENGPRIAGAGIADTRIDFDQYAVWRRWLVAKNLTMNVAFTENPTAFDVLDRIARVGRGVTSWAGGKLTPLFEDDAAIPVATFGPSQMVVNSFRISYSSADVASEFVGVYAEPEAGWSQREVRAFVGSATVPNSEAKLDLWGVTTEEQAQREINIAAMRASVQRRTIEFKTTGIGLILRRMDVINVNHNLVSNAFATRIINASGGVYHLARPIEIEAAAIYSVQLQRPDMTVQNTTVSLPAGKHKTVTLPIVVDVFGDDDAIPDDYILTFIPEGGSLLRMRITEIEYDKDLLTTIRCVDDDVRIWQNEYNAVTLDPLASPQRRVAVAYDVSASKDPCTDNWTLQWTLQDSINCDVLFTRNGVQGTYRVSGEVLQLGTLPSGSYSVTITPVPEQPWQVKSATYTWIVP